MPLVGQRLEAAVADGQLRVLVDGTGLSDRHRDRLFDHSSRKEDMWIVALSEADEGLVFDLGREVELETLQIWNYNETGYTGRGVASLNVSVWTQEQGWKTLLRDAKLDEACGTDDYDTPTLLTISPVRARKVRLENLRPFADEGFAGLSAIRFYEPATFAACNPLPADGAERGPAGRVSLAWTPGRGAVVHEVYAGLGEGELAFLGRIVPSQVDLTGIVSGRTYRWRVDEVRRDGSVTPGPEWSFVVGEGGCVAHWAFDEESGTTIYDSVGGREGVIHGGAQMDGSGYLRLDGGYDYAELPIGELVGGLYYATFAIWVDFSGGGGPWQRMFDFGSGSRDNMFLTPRMGSDGPMRFALKVHNQENLRLTADSALPPGLRHVAVTIGGDEATLYLDGEPLASEAVIERPCDMGWTDRNWLGRSQYRGDALFDGAIHEFSIYDRSLTQEEIRNLYAGIRPGPAPVASVEPALALAGAELLAPGADLDAIAEALARGEPGYVSPVRRNLTAVAIIAAAVVAAVLIARVTRRQSSPHKNP